MTIAAAAEVEGVLFLPYSKYQVVLVDKEFHYIYFLFNGSNTAKDPTGLIITATSAYA
jgi:hypothetical protein